MTNSRTRSITWRLIGAVLAAEFAAAVLVIFLSWGYERHAHFRAFDIMLHGRADSVLGAVQDAEDAQDNVMLDTLDLRLPADEVYEVYDERGRLLGRSPNWTGSGEGYAAQAKDGIVRRMVNGQHYRLLRLHGSRIVDPGEPNGGTLRHVEVLYGVPTARVWDAIWRSVAAYAVGSLLLLLVTGPLVAWVLHRGLAPLRQLAALAGNVSADAWEFEPPETARTTRELAPLTHALESVLQRLEVAFVQQRTFVSDAAHELKTAVAVVKSSLQLLCLRTRTPAEYQAGLDRCLADTGRLEDLVAKMLTLARVESAAASAAPASCDAVQCLEETIRELETVAALRQVQIEKATPETARVPLTAEDCQLVVSNLLLNALQHSPAGSRVQLNLSGMYDAVELRVADHGEGIDPTAQPHVFDRFFRGDPSRSRATGGAGLGLAICKALVEKAGGSIALASTPGQGTIVTVRMPHA
jgi:signal transduction histidine kinase